MTKSKASLGGLLRVGVPDPMDVPVCGSGALHGEQQWWYEKGYRAGVAAARRAMRYYVSERKVTGLTFEL